MAQTIAMTSNLYHACATRGLRFLQEQPDECLKLSSTSAEGNTILHIILDPAFVDRDVDMTPILKRVPELISIANNRGDNPVHYAARITSRPALKFLSSCKEIWSRCASTNRDSPPWLARNLEGNIPLHEALLSRHAIYAQVLIALDNESAQFSNASKETPLHLCARYTQECSASLETRDDVVELRGTDELTLLLNAYGSAAFLRDDDGFTPIMRAAKCGRLHMVNQIRERYPDSAKLRDFGGRTFLHVLHVSKMEEATFFETLPIGSQMVTLQDNDGNTPLHLAVKRRQYRKIRVLAGIKETWDAVLNTEDSDGATPFDLIRSQGDAPLKIRMMVCPKSSKSIVNDVSEATLRSHFNYLSVVSILLVTFTFAAAYSVPGGFDSATGVSSSCEYARIQGVCDPRFLCTKSLVYGVALHHVRVDRRSYRVTQIYKRHYLFFPNSMHGCSRSIYVGYICDNVPQGKGGCSRSLDYWICLRFYLFGNIFAIGGLAPGRKKRSGTSSIGNPSLRNYLFLSKICSLFHQVLVLV